MADHSHYAEIISVMIRAAALARGKGIAHRYPDYIRRKMEEGLAIIALAHESDQTAMAGFSYLSTWENEQYVANSGLIVNKRFRQQGLARQIKEVDVKLSQQKFPHAKLFSITSSLAVMNINTDLGYRPVTFAELPTDDTFWNRCGSCPNYDILMRNQRRKCLCTAILMHRHNVKNDYKGNRLTI